MARLSSILPLPRDVGIEGGSILASGAAEVKLPAWMIHGHARADALGLAVRIGQRRMTGEVSVAITARATKGDRRAVDVSGTSLDIRNLRTSDTDPANDHWWRHLALHRATLNLDPGLTFDAVVDGRARDAQPADAIIAASTAIPEWVTSALRMTNLQLKGVVRATPSESGFTRSSREGAVPQFGSSTWAEGTSRTPPCWWSSATSASGLICSRRNQRRPRRHQVVVFAAIGSDRARLHPSRQPVRSILKELGRTSTRRDKAGYPSTGSREENRMYKLVLLRHGESTWNKENRFTGWTDVDLSDRGRHEATTSGQVLRAEGYGFDLAYTSVLKRAIRTLWLALDEMELMWIPVQGSWRLNERHYGALQGLNKAETAAKYGEAQVKIWRRSFDIPPPALVRADPRFPGHDPRYRDLTTDELPLTECLKDTAARVLPLWTQTIAPGIKSGRRTFVAHGNSLRALVKYLDKVPPSEIVELNIPTGIPLVYELDDELNPVKHYYLGDPAAIAEATHAVANQGKTS